MSTEAVERTFKQVIKPSMWIGDVNALSALVKECRELEELSHADVRSEFRQTADARRDEFLTSFAAQTAEPEELERLWQRADKSQIARALADLSLSLTVSLMTYAEELTGRPEDVLAQISRPDEVISAELTMGRMYVNTHTPRHSGMEIMLDERGGRAALLSGSKHWVDTAKNRIENQLRRQRPWYFVAGGHWGPVLIVFLPLWLSAMIISFALFQNQSAESWVYVLLFGSPILIALCPLFYWDKFVPRFEVYADGKKARGHRVLYIFGAAILQLVVSILIPLLMR
jgi:hypothetical protein